MYFVKSQQSLSGIYLVTSATLSQTNTHKTVDPFSDSMTVHRDKFLVNKTNRRTEFQYYWYYDSTCFGQPFCPSSGVLSRTGILLFYIDLMTVYEYIYTYRGTHIHT
jgi:hypothetical protein